MSKRQFLEQTLRENWYLVAAMIILVAAIAVRLVLSMDEGGAQDDAPPPPRRATAHQPLVTPDAPAPTRMRDAEVLEMIDDYRERVENDPEHPDAPATLMAIGNLYRDRLQDCEQAAAYYEQAIREYPDSINRRDMYIQLADCYDRTQNFTMRDAVYRDTLEYFPPDSEEYLWARQQLPD